MSSFPDEVGGKELARICHRLQLGSRDRAEWNSVLLIIPVRHDELLE
jgi:hypothetical protein